MPGVHTPCSVLKELPVCFGSELVGRKHASRYRSVGGGEGCPRRRQSAREISSFILFNVCLWNSVSAISSPWSLRPSEPPGVFCRGFLCPAATCIQCASIGFSLKLHSRNQNSYVYPLQTCLLHKLETYQMNWARYFFFLPSVALVWHHC